MSLMAPTKRKIMVAFLSLALLLLFVMSAAAEVSVVVEEVEYSSSVGVGVGVGIGVGDDDEDRSTEDETGGEGSYEGEDPAAPDVAISCISEKNLDFGHLDLANVQLLQSKSISACASHCLSEFPSRSHMLIGFKSRALLSDQFVCACADEEAFSGRVDVLPLSRCDQACPDKPSYRCGDAGDDVLSVYCLRRGCRPPEENVAPVCARRRPHDPHGCVHEQQVSWAHAHNVRNFTASVEDDTACIWECHDRHASSMYSLTRQIGGDVLTCSCGYPRAFAPNLMAETEFCSMLPAEAPVYRVNCVGDLDPDGGEPGWSAGNSSAGCPSILPLGCVFRDLLFSGESNSSFSSLISVSDVATADPQVCHSACYSVYGASVSHVGVRWDASGGDMECACLAPGAFDPELDVGPEAACDQQCNPEGTGLMCGGPSGASKSIPPALSLYCLHRGGEGVENSTNVDWALALYGSNSVLSHLHQAMRSGYVAGDIAVAMLTLLCVILLAIVVYLCVTKGFLSLSRQAM